MPKIKTKSSVKKRFQITANRKIKSTQAFKQHNMRKRSKRSLNELKRTTILNNIDSKKIFSYIPYI